MDQVDVRKTANEVPVTKPAHANTASVRNKLSSKRPSYLLAIILIIVFVALEFGFWGTVHYVDSNSAMSSINKNEYQAAFLTNGQVYFGRITAINSNYLKIVNIYYLQAQQTVQPANSSAQKLSLVKLGNEIHGPEDEMYIARPQILFWENLKNNSKVVQAITNQG